MSTSPLLLKVLSASFGEEAVRLPLAGTDTRCTLRLRCLAGAKGIHLLFTGEDEVLLRCEVPADGGEAVAIEVERGANGELYVASRGRELLFLPPQERYDPARPVLPARRDAPLDLALVIDGTARPAAAEAWDAHCARLLAFAGRVVEERPDCRAAVIAFGDQPPPGVLAADLVPQYHLFPGEEGRGLQPFDLVRLRRDLLAVPPTSGGDFVDAVADGLVAAAGLRWRDQARKLVLLSGDSPGHSILHPLRRGADLGVRERDVDVEAMRLHQRGVETVTLYHDPPVDSGLYDLAFKRDLLLGARAQYARLASVGEYAFELSVFDPLAAADLVRDYGRAIGRGTSWGELIELSAGPATSASAAPIAHQAGTDADDDEVDELLPLP